MSLDIKQTSIARDLHLSQGQVSKLIAGEQNNPRFDEWIIRQLREKFIAIRGSMQNSEWVDIKILANVLGFKTENS